MFLAGLHTVGRDDPQLFLQIDFAPAHPNYLAGPAGGQDCEFQSLRCHGLPSLSFAMKSGSCS